MSPRKAAAALLTAAAVAGALLTARVVLRAWVRAERWSDETPEFGEGVFDD